jgi:ribose transport system ATP-binding protein
VTENVLDLVAIEKSFGAVPVLRGVTLGVAAGEVHALLGENGAGKSTLMKIVLGIERPTKGTMTLAGAPYAPRSPGEARAAGVVMVPQERTLCPDLTVAENVMLGLERALLRRREAEASAERALALVSPPRARAGGSIDPRARARDLKVADQQLVEIARALAHGAGGAGGGGRGTVLVLDEPTSSLGHDDAERLFERVRALRDAGLAIVLVTHFLSDVRDHADRYTVLRDGTVAGQGDPKSTPPEQIVREMGASSAVLGRAPTPEVSPQASRRPEGARTDALDAGDVLLELRGVGGRQRPRDVSLTLRRGEIVGIAGLVGSGRTELLRIIAGLDPPARGEVRRSAHLAGAGRGGIGLLSEDRGGEGLMLLRPIADNVTLSPRSPLFAWPAAALAEGERWIDELGIKARGPEQAVGELSGGNQQKVQLARLLREDYDVLLVDEPTRGIDVAAKAQILGIVRRLAAAGKGILLVSSQLEELVTTCDRIAVLRRGELGPSRPAAECSEDRLLLEASS